jgi:hypothetical protein
VDSNGARHLLARLAIGVPVGSRFEVVALEAGVPLQVGDTGTLVALEDGRAHLSVDVRGELDVDPHSVTLRQLLQRTA